MPTLNAPVPDDYVMGPGDILQVQLFGSENQNLNLMVSAKAASISKTWAN